MTMRSMKPDPRRKRVRERSDIHNVMPDDRLDSIHGKRER